MTLPEAALETGHTHDPQLGLPGLCSQAGLGSHLQPLPVPLETLELQRKSPQKPAEPRRRARSAGVTRHPATAGHGP